MPSALRHRRFAFFFLAACISNGAAWMQTVAVPALLYDLTGSATWLGLSALAALAPGIVITPFAGVMSDRLNRRAILLATQSIQMASTMALWLLFVTDRISPMRILACGLVTGVATGFQTATWQAFIPSLVPPDDMLDAVRLNSLNFTMARAAGPLAAAVAVQRWGTGAAILANGLTYLFVIAALVCVRPRAQAYERSDQHPWQALREGAAYVNGQPVVRTATILAFVTALIGQPIQHISAAVSSELFHRPSEDNAWLLASLGIGAVVAGLTGNQSLRRLGRIGQIRLALGCFATSVGIVSASSEFVVGQVGYFIGGIAHITLAMALNQAIQLETPDEFRGRALSFYVLGILAGIPLGAMVAGTLADVIGLRPIMIVEAAILVLGSAWVTRSGALNAFGERPTTHTVLSP